MNNTIAFEVEGVGPRTIAIQRAIIAGWTGRNSDAVNHHIAELKAIGVRPPSSVPLFYRVSAGLISIASVLETVGDTGSGEAEPLLISDGGTLYLGLGSDHTDRELEAHSVALSKQICGKPIAPRLWQYDEVADHLDDIVIQSFVRETAVQDWTLYQEGTLASIRPLAELMRASPAAEKGGLASGTAMMCGTFAVVAGGVRPARQFRMVMTDPKFARTIEHMYQTVPLPAIA
jgi:hypothetical protein